MIVNTQWLLEYLEPKCTHDEIIDLLPMLGLEIERTHVLRSELANIRIGFVRKKSPIPEKPGKYLCQIELRQGQTIPVVCKSEHAVEVGWGVPIAVAGVTLPTGYAIEDEKMSQGMICLDGEMGMLARGSGMHHFLEESLLGESLPATIDISECLLELNVLPNRPDLLGIVGIAREVAAALSLRLCLPPTLLPNMVSSNSSLPVEIHEPELCRRYVGCAVRNVRVAESPAWLKARLMIAGMAAINNVVDVTNYVMYEFGQPLHAFDFDKIRGGKIIVRRFSTGETLQLLTGSLVAADRRSDDSQAFEKALVIADAERPIALAGIMGGADTQTTLATSTVLLEAAHFSAGNIRQSAKQIDLGLSRRGTDASDRFARGTDPNAGLELAFQRGLYLLGELAGGTVASAPTDAYPSKVERRVFQLPARRASGYLGLSIDSKVIQDWLERLGVECEVDGDVITARAPTWRVDIDDPVVLIEDVVRMIGYDKISAAPTAAEPTLGATDSLSMLRHAVAEHLVSAGFYECRNPPLEGPDMSTWLGAPDPLISLSHPQSADLSVMRRTLVPGLVRTVQNNIRRGARAIRFFEIDRVYDATGIERHEGHAPPGNWRIAAVAGGLLQSLNWRAAGQQVDFYCMKGALIDMLDSIGSGDATLRPFDGSPFIAGLAAEVLVGNSQSVGRIGELDPTIVGLDRISFPLYAFELRFDCLLPPYLSPKTFQHLNRQPPVTRDLALVVPFSTPFAELQDTIQQVGGPMLESLQLVDRYQGAQVAAGHHSLAFHLVFRDSERTLTAEEIDLTIDRLLAALTDRFGAKLRS